MKNNGLAMHLWAVITCLSISSFSVTTQAESITFGSDNIAGHGAAAFGYSTTASGNYSSTFGRDTTALGGYSTAFGYETVASGGSSASFGYRTNASATMSAAFGMGSVASGDASFALGFYTNALGKFSLAAGERAESAGEFSVAFGLNTVASGNYSSVFGIGTEAQSMGQFVLGEYNYLYPDVSSQITSPFDPLFVVGNGTSRARSNAMTVFRNGHTVMHNNLTVLGRITTASDERRKHSISPLTNSMDRIRQLNPVSYIANNDDTNKTQIGFIAQEVELTVPEVVHIDQEGDYSVAYGQVTALLTDAVQTLDAENKQLNSQVLQLKSALCEFNSTFEFCN